MRGLFSSFSVVLACTALGAGDTGVGKDHLKPNPLTVPPGAISQFQLLPAAKAGGQVCMTELQACEPGCDLDYAAGAAGCAIHGFTAMAAICHASNSAFYGACLAGCRYG